MLFTRAKSSAALRLAKTLSKEKDQFADPVVADKSAEWIEDWFGQHVGHEVDCHDLATFWPPRCVQAFSENNGTAFFGAGVSLPAGFPSWQALLVEYFQLDPALVEDDDLKNDPLTLAELAGQVLGNESLQQRLREVFSADKPTTTAHRLLVQLKCGVYVTTNYDALLEKAWAQTTNRPLFVATNDTHLDRVDEILQDPDGSVLFKIHGCVNRPSEHLILTRRDYRHHYRANEKFFKKIIEFLLKRHTLFVGFSHRDPEVSRLVDDAIHTYENGLKKRRSPWPQLYSLQFDMRSHTPEIFAARGIVALTPPPPRVDTDPHSIRSQSLAASLCDLAIATSLGFHQDRSVRLDKDLLEIVVKIEKPINDALRALEACNQKAEKTLRGGPSAWIDRLVVQLGSLASQGVFLADENGFIKACSLPKGLSSKRKKTIIDLGVSQRPYFQIANSYRRPFVSDLAPSIFNEHGTFFLCQPILQGHFSGLLFSAAQIGQWCAPIEFAQSAWKANRAFILVDSNGRCLLPAFGEFEPSWRAWDEDVERKALNVGYPYKKLVALSRRDQLVRHIARSVVPVQQDDDVLILAKDSGFYTVVSELANTRWKVALSMSMKK